MTTHTEFQRLLSRDLDGELSAAESAALKQHLYSCGDCRREHRQFARMQQVMRADDSVKAPVGLAQRIVAHVERDGADVAAVVRSVQWLRRSAVAAAVLAMALLSVQLASQPDEAVADTGPANTVEAPLLRPDFVRVLKRQSAERRRPLPFLDLFVPERAELAD